MGGVGLTTSLVAENVASARLTRAFTRTLKAKSLKATSRPRFESLSARLCVVLLINLNCPMPAPVFEPISVLGPKPLVGSTPTPRNKCTATV